MYFDWDRSNKWNAWRQIAYEYFEKKYNFVPVSGHTITKAVTKGKGKVCAEYGSSFEGVIS